MGSNRNVFFSFHYADIMRVNNVRLCQEFKTREHPKGTKSIEGFYDWSLWEDSKKKGEDALKNLIRDGVKNTSVVCVLAGSNTYTRRWVKYEIARSVIDQRGLVAIHINTINHHEPPFLPHEKGPNPLYYMGVALGSNGNFYLCDRYYSQNDQSWAWRWYADYTGPVPLPKYMRAPAYQAPTRLSEVTQEYDWVSGSHNQIGRWLDNAAIAAGR
jgi:hypothetical protein